MKSTVNSPTRRRAVAGIAAAMACVVSTSPTNVFAQQPAMEEKPSTGVNKDRTSLHQEIELKAASQRVFEILLDARQFAALTGMSAEIDPKPGGTFKTFGGLIEGRNVELVPGVRIVQAWRPSSWEPGVYTLAHFELKPSGAETMLVLDHTGFFPGDFDHFDTGWHERYWEPLKKYLAGQG